MFPPSSTQVEEGWWSGALNGKSGLFPSNFVKELDAAGEDGETNDTAAADETGKGRRTKVENEQDFIDAKGAASFDWNIMYNNGQPGSVKVLHLSQPQCSCRDI